MGRKLPKVHDNNKKGNIAVGILVATLSRFAITHTIPVEEDIGVDVYIELLNGSVPNGDCFNIQCKGKDEVEIDENSIRIPIKITTINYWLLQRQPTFLFVVDIDNLNVFWCYPYTQIYDRLDEIQKQKTVTILLEKRNVFSLGIRELPKAIYKYIREFDYKLIEDLSQSISNAAFEVESRKEGTLSEKLQAFNNSARTLKENYIKIIDGQRDQFILDQTKIIVEKFRNVVRWLDYESPHIYQYTKGQNIYEADGFVENSNIKEFIKNVMNSIDRFENQSSEENFRILTLSLEELNDLNMNLAFFLREILYELSEYGDYEYLVEEYLPKDEN